MIANNEGGRRKSGNMKAVPGIPGEWFSFRWEGKGVPRYTEPYTFYTVAERRKGVSPH